MGFSLKDRIKIAIEAAGRLVSGTPPGSCLNAEARGLLLDLEEILESLNEEGL